MVFGRHFLGSRNSVGDIPRTVTTIVYIYIFVYLLPLLFSFLLAVVDRNSRSQKQYKRLKMEMGKIVDVADDVEKKGYKVWKIKITTAINNE